MPNEPGQDAVILRRRDYCETSLLLDIFSEPQGRLNLLAKGAKRGRTPGAAFLQCFAPLRLSWTGRGELPVLTAAEPCGEAFALRGTALYCGFYLNELLSYLLPPLDPYPEVFRLYLDTLGRLAQADDSAEPALRGFEVGLLEHLGYGLCLDREAGSGRPVDPARTYAYHIESGPVACPPDHPAAIHGSTLLDLGRDRLESPVALKEAKHLMRRVVQYYLDGRGLKSRDLFQPSTGKAPHA
ncbi:DNA repair protein RecO [Methylomagnum ishizawai]|uniref:DNA repair protein RecO n=1 Tax=Methylomagnum ishizawai TaxID=1760988 RepID=UPI001C341A3E|nr:DNA repair protein RecO [Methylomagnum ishizawai]BBL76047.1 DNA repair protein RecO [Methylomagnum ishizawai]